MSFLSSLRIKHSEWNGAAERDNLLDSRAKNEEPGNNSDGKQRQVTGQGTDSQLNKRKSIECILVLYHQS